MHRLNPDIPNTDIAAGDNPFGTARNTVTPGDGTATPLIEKWLNDLYYAFYAPIFKSGLVPSGVQENTNNSDFYNALILIMNTHKSTDFFNPTPQDSPNNTIKLARGVTRDPDDPTSEPVVIAAGAADAITFPGVTADSRIDRLVFNKTGAIIQKLGVQAAFPTPPALVEGEGPICRTLVTTIGAPIFDNIQDLIIPERIINRLQKSVTAGLTSAKATSHTRSIAAGSGVQLVPHGMTQIPNKLRFNAGYDQLNGASFSGDCIFNGSTYEQMCNMFSSSVSLAKPAVKLGSVLHVQQNAGVDTYTGIVTDIDITNVHITWTAVGGAIAGNIPFGLLASVT